MTDQFFFAPDDDCLTPLLEEVNKAEKTILIADYSYNLPQLTQALIYKKNNGVNVRMVLDKSQSKGKYEIPEITALRNAAIDLAIGTSDKHKIMHLKVAVIDDETVIFGSYNFTSAAALESNVLAIFDDPDLAKKFTLQINKIYAWIKLNNVTLTGGQMDYRDVAVRAAKTFGQAFVAFLVGSGLDWFHLPSLDVGKKLLLAAALAGVSAVWNLVLVPLFQPVTQKLGL